MLYEMLAGELPFAGETAFETTSAILEKAPRPLPSSVSPSLGAVVERCLEKDPSCRYADGRELHTALAGIAGDAPFLRTVVRARFVRRYLSAAAIGFIVLVLASGGWFLVRNQLAAPAGIQSIAVLPLKNLSGDPQQEYFADGVTEELTAAIANVSALRVISRTSVTHYKESPKSVPQIARELNVDAVLEGSVLRAGTRVRVVVQLIAARQDRHLWTETYDRNLADLLSLQSEVARTVAQAIKIRMTPMEMSRLSLQRPVDPQALDLYLRGHQLLRPGGAPKAAYQALAFFESALEKEPNFALAYAGSADAYTYMASGAFLGTDGKTAEPAGRALVAAQKAAERALQLDPSLADAHVSLAAVLAGERDWEGSLNEVRSAVKLNPSLAQAYVQGAHVLSHLDRVPEAVAMARIASSLDLLSESLCLRLFDARQYEQALQEGRRALAAGGPRGMHLTLARIDLQMRRYEDAIDELALMPMLMNSAPNGPREMRAALAQGGPAAVFRWYGAYLQRQNWRPILPSVIAWFYAKAGDSERAVKLLRQGLDEDRISFTWSFADPGWDSLRTDPRFVDILRQANLPQSLTRRR